MSAFTAMLIDAYRELNSKKLFWIILALSGLIVVYYASMGFDDKGMFMLFGLVHIESEFLREGTTFARILYVSIFSSFIVGIWLAWIATILALVSTTTVFPDFVAGGSIDLVLSKPLSRIRLFLYKYFTSLLFVLLQFGLFCIGMFLCVGWRLGEWNWKILWAIPVLLLFYSYLFSVNVLVGVVTRSAITALLLTMLFWFSLFGINATEGILNQFMMTQTIELEDLQRERAATAERLEALADIDDPEASGARTRTQMQLEQHDTQIEAIREVVGKLDRWHGPTRTIQTALPKTSETIGLIERWLKDPSGLNILDMMSGNMSSLEGGERPASEQSIERRVQQRMLEEYDARSLWYVIGTSLLFEFVVLGAACVVFARRDY